ncbi:hypothetical protein GCM10011490_28970 [Pseudoclavibacter endophyticus]|nr:hypothetical protein GCM10011490_28970 [Pseudoclavibacter endophyticus]
MPAGVVSQEARAAEPPPEVKVEHAVAATARRQAMELDDGVAALVAQFDVEHGTWNNKGRHGGSVREDGVP